MKNKNRIIAVVIVVVLLLAAAGAYACASCLDTYAAQYVWPDGATAWMSFKARDAEDAGRRAWQIAPPGGRLISVQPWPPQRVPPSVWVEEASE